MSISNQINRVKTKLSTLRKLDTELETFGAKAHEYQLNETIASDLLEAYERRNKIQLPEEYKAFLIEMGNGGAGPCYGIRPLPLASTAQAAVVNEDYQPIDLQQPFPLTEQWNLIATAQDEKEYDALEDEYFDNKWINGTIAIVHYGCGVFYHLVVNGEEAGHIWMDDRNSDGGIFPILKIDDGKRTSFLDWYERWLDHSIEELTNKDNL